MANIGKLSIVFPARAGMSPGPQVETLSRKCVPRASGDEPEAGDIAPVEPTCSPRERG